MANSSLNWFGNRARVGLGGATGGSFSKFQMDLSPKYQIGWPIFGPNGDVYHYSQFGANTNRGVLVATDVSESAVVDTDNAIIAPASAVSVADQPNIKPGALGSFYVQITLASVTTNLYSGGKFITTDDTGEGYTYDILGNTATDVPATGSFLMTIAQPIQVAVDTTTDFSIAASRYVNLELATAGTDECVSGVSCSTVVIATAPFAVIQSKGIVGILQDGTIALGDIVTLSDGVAGAAQALGGGDTIATDLISEPIIGYCYDPGDTTGHGSFVINLE